MVKVCYKNKVKDVKRGKTKKGEDYTKFTISDKVKEESGNGNEWQYYTFIVWNNVKGLKDGDTVRIGLIDGIEVSTREYQGKVYKNFTLFGEVAVENQEPNNNPSIDDGSLPF